MWLQSSTRKPCTAVSIFEIGISWNTKCDNAVGFPKSGDVICIESNSWLVAEGVNNYCTAQTFYGNKTLWFASKLKVDGFNFTKPSFVLDVMTVV